MPSDPLYPHLNVLGGCDLSPPQFLGDNTDTVGGHK